MYAWRERGRGREGGKGEGRGWMDGWMEGGNRRVEGREGGGGDGQVCMHAWTHAHTHTCMHAPMHTHTSSSSASEICGVGRISLLLFLASLALPREGHTFTSRHTRLADSMLPMYLHTYTGIGSYEHSCSNGRLWHMMCIQHGLTAASS